MTLAVTLQQALDQLSRPAPMRLPDVPRCVDAMARATTGLADAGDPIDPKYLAGLVGRFQQAAASGDFSVFRPKEWRGVVWGLWLEPEPLAENESFLRQLFERLRAGGRALCRTLLIAWLHAFDAAKNSIRRIGRELAQVVARENWEWADRAERYALFDPDRGPKLLAAACLESRAPISECLAAAGITGSRRFGGMEGAAFARAVYGLGASLAGGDAGAPALLDRVLDWAVHERALAFPGQKTRLAEALLLPWQDRVPADALRERITEFLLRHFKDPRIEPISWHGVDEAALRVIRRWLTRVALEQFLQVVDKVADREQWRYRRAFWMAYYEAGLIDEAWVLFGPSAERLGKWGLRELAGYGRLIRPSVSNHCVLLMRLAGDLTIAEISHNGRCRAWLPGQKTAPLLYHREYEVSDISQNASFDVVHQRSEQLQWQRKIAAFLASNAGLRVPETNFQPR